MDHFIILKSLGTLREFPLVISLFAALGRRIAVVLYIKKRLYLLQKHFPRHTISTNTGNK